MITQYSADGFVVLANALRHFIAAEDARKLTEARQIEVSERLAAIYGEHVAIESTFTFELVEG
jgi:hypothetical protein